MAAPKTDAELMAMVRRGGGQAFTAMGCLMKDKRDYPGNVADIFGLLPDTGQISFCYSPSDLAQAYLFDKGHIRESDLADRWQVKELLGCFSSSESGPHEA